MTQEKGREGNRGEELREYYYTRMSTPHGTQSSGKGFEWLASTTHSVIEGTRLLGTNEGNVMDIAADITMGTFLTPRDVLLVKPPLERSPCTRVLLECFCKAVTLNWGSHEQHLRQNGSGASSSITTTKHNTQKLSVSQKRYIRIILQVAYCWCTTTSLRNRKYWTPNAPLISDYNLRAEVQHWIITQSS